MLARSGKLRTFRDNQLLGISLCATSGFMNAGGLFVVDVVTSHVTGHWTNVGKELALGNLSVALKVLAWVFAFLMGAIFSTFLVETNRTERRRSIYVRPVVVEWLLVTVFAFAGSNVAALSPEWKAVLAGYLCFTLGVQNALLSRLTGGAVRGTHMTGITTDLGIELVRLFFVTRERVRLVRLEGGGIKSILGELFAISRSEASHKTRLLSSMLVSFVFGAVFGTLSYFRWGSLGALPVAIALAFLAGRELLELKREIEHERREHERRTVRHPGLSLPAPLPRVSADPLAKPERSTPPAMPPATPQPVARHETIVRLESIPETQAPGKSAAS